MKRNVLDWLTTAAGVVGAAAQASQADPIKAIHGDAGEQQKLLGAVVIGFLGWAIHKPTTEAPK